MWEEVIVRESGLDMDTLLDLSRRTSKDLLDSTQSSAQCHMAAWMRGEFGGEWIHVCNMYVYIYILFFTKKPSNIV